MSLLDVETMEDSCSPADVTDPVEVTFLLFDQSHFNECVDDGNQPTVSDVKFSVSGRRGIGIRTPGILGG
jgi:hypothetical protein